MIRSLEIEYQCSLYLLYVTSFNLKVLQTCLILSSSLFDGITTQSQSQLLSFLNLQLHFSQH